MYPRMTLQVFRLTLMHVVFLFVFVIADIFFSFFVFLAKNKHCHREFFSTPFGDFLVDALSFLLLLIS